MSETFVDVTYRGLEVGRRLRIRDFTADGAYVEAPMPMPVGSSIEIAIEGGATIKAIVARVHEQVGGSDRPPGMGVRATIDQAARAWWEKMIAASPAPPEPPPHPVGEGDGGKTQVMTAVEVPDADDDAAPIVDDGKRTMTMSAVEIEAIVAQASGPVASPEDSGELEAANGDGDDEDVSQDGPSNGANGAAKKRKRRRKKK